jgi:1-deoxy-D-xylulose-5-phosphate reductoisomerase
VTALTETATIPRPAAASPSNETAETPRRIVILGSTGSIGRSALDVVRHYPGRFEVVGLGAHSNVDLLHRQVMEFKPAFVAMSDLDAAKALQDRVPEVAVWSGPEGLERLGAVPADIVLCAVVGAVGLKPLLSALDAGNSVALANKEPLVMAGRLVMERARARGVQVLPVDSEHNAIFQCLQGHRIEDVQCVHLTASGGPFYGRSRESLRAVTPDQAARHPTWDMGRKISVDSATLMNKGLEVVEAMWLFGLPLDKIQVVIHPQSIVHSLVEFTDGSILAHLGITDMKFPILFALTWPERVQSPMGRLDLTRMRELTFGAPDFSEFPCLGYAFRAARTGGTAPALLNAANEMAVEAFCRRRIPFLGICDVVGGVLDACAARADSELESVLEADREARRAASRIIETM